MGCLDCSEVGGWFVAVDLACLLFFDLGCRVVELLGCVVAVAGLGCVVVVGCWLPFVVVASFAVVSKGDSYRKLVSAGMFLFSFVVSRVSDVVM